MAGGLSKSEKSMKESVKSYIKALSGVGLKIGVIVGLFLISITFPRMGTAAEGKGGDTGPDKSAYEVERIRLAGGDWGYPSPFAHYPRGPGGFKMCLIFDSLLERDETGLIPWLAQGYEIENSGKSYLFTIRKGVKWHDGHPLTPEDVIFSMEYANGHAMTWSYIFNAIESVGPVGDNKVRVTLKQPSAPMLYNIGRTRIIPKHIWETVENPKAFTTPEAVIGSGPYCLDHYSKAHGTYRFTAFKDFWGPKQRVGILEFVPISQPIPAFENRKIDLTAIPPDLLNRYKGDEGCRVIRNPAFWGYRLIFNMEQSPLFARKEFRQAFRYAMDLEALVEKIARGAAVPGSAGILPPGHVMYHAGVKQYEQNYARAAQLLTLCSKNGAGESNGLSFELLCSSREVRMAEMIREFLGKAGVNIHIRSVDGKTRDVRVKNHEFELAVIGHGGWGSDADYLRLRFMSGSTTTNSSSPSASGIRGYENKRVNTLLAAQHLEIDKEKRHNMIHEIQEILAEDLPEIPLYYTAGYTVYRPEKYDGWQFMFDHHSVTHSKLSYLHTPEKQ